MTMFAVLLIVGLNAAPASAWTTWGCKWNHKNITYWAPSPLVSYPAWTNAASSWSGLDAKFVYASSTYDVYATNENRGNTVTWSGVTRKKGTVQSTPACSSSGYMTSGQVEVVLNWSVVSSYTAAKRQGVAAHELGHAFGLGHVTTKSILMYGTDERTVTTPQSDDKAGVNALY